MRNIPVFRLYISLFFFVCFTPAAIASTEKLYVVTDKQHYSPGETVQFQVFVRDHSATSNSTVFVDLLDCNGNNLAKKMFPADLNSASGNIMLPDTGNAVFYILYFYTINNDIVEYDLTKKIFLKEQPNNRSEKKVNISYFFEGGTFIAESVNNILLRSVDEDDRPVKVSGQVMDDKKQVYTWFETDEEGLAMIRVNPEKDVPCFIALDDRPNEKILFPLASPSGVTLNIEAYGDSIIYTALSFSPATDKLEYVLEALYNGQPVFDVNISFQQGYSFVQEELKRTDLPQGFLTFRLIDKAKNTCAQRIFYNPGSIVQNNSITIIDTITNRKVKIDLPDNINGKGYMKITAMPGDSIGHYKELNFITNTGNKGLSFNSRLIAMKEAPAIIEKDTVNRYLSVTGTLLNSDGQPLKNRNVNLVIVQKNLSKQFLIAKTDDNAVLKVNNLVFYDSAKIYYQLTDRTEDKNNVQLDLQVTPSSFIKEKKIPVNYFSCMTGIVKKDGIKVKNNFLYIDSDPSIRTLQEVTVKAATAKQKTASEIFREKNVSAQFDKTALLRNEFDFIANPQVVDNVSILTFISMRFSGLTIRNINGGKPTINSSSGGTVGVYLNDAQLETDPKKADYALDIINNLTVRDVALVRYYSLGVRPKSVYFDGGDIMIYTRTDASADPKVKGLPKTSVAGYSNTNLAEKPSPTTNSASLFWKPDWIPEQNEIIYLALPPTVNTSNIQLIIEGINPLMAPYRFIKKLEFL